MEKINDKSNFPTLDLDLVNMKVNNPKSMILNIIEINNFIIFTSAL